MKRPASRAAAAALLLALTSAARAAPIGTDNYDFAAFDPALFTHDPAHDGGWTPPGFPRTLHNQALGRTFAGGTQLLADVDGDGRVDRLAYALDAGGWRIWTSRSSGDGTFAPATSWQAAGNWPGWSLVAADVDGDGAADLIARVSDGSGWRNHVARSLRNGSFAPPVAWSHPGDFTGWTPLVADFTGDRRADVLLSRVDPTGWHIALAAADGAGSFAAPVSTALVGPSGSWRIGAGDFDGDGRADLSLDASDPSSWRVRVALAAGDRSFAAAPAWASRGNYAGHGAVRGDVDADGRTDLVLSKVDAASWRVHVALATGAGGFAPPMTWTSPTTGPGWSPAAASWALSVGDVNGDRGADLILQTASATGWQARVAVGSGRGSFFPPRPWGALARHFGGWSLAAGDFSGDGRTDLMAFAVDALGWRAHVAVARGCGHVIGPDDDVAAELAALPPGPGRRTVCLEPGLYQNEILIANVENLSLVAAHGGAVIASSSYAFAPSAEPGQDPGAPVQIWQSHGVVLDGLEIRNLFEYELVVGPDGELDQTYMVSRAVEILDSTSIVLSNSYLVGPGKQLLHVDGSQDAVVEASRLDCYYFCVDARFSTIELRGSAFRAEHETPGDVHSLFWTDHSSQRYIDCAMEMITGKSLFAGVNDFATDLLEVIGRTEVSPSAEAWVSQHPNYDGMNVSIRGLYPALLDWYFVDFMGGGWSPQAQICYEPAVGPGHCVSHL